MTEMMAANEANRSIGRVEMLTGEELMVFAAARGLTLPPGTPGIAERFNASEETQALTSLATRTLLCRGVGVGDEPSETARPAGVRDHDLEAMLLAICEPEQRVVVTAGVAQDARVVAFSTVADKTVAQILLPMDLHLLSAIGADEVRSSVVDATQLASATESSGDPIRFELDRSQAERIRAAGPEGLESVLGSLQGWQSLDDGARTSLRLVLSGETFIASVLFHRVARRASERDESIVLVSWAVTPDGAVWRLDTSVPLPGGEGVDGGGMTVVRSGRAEIEERIVGASDAIGIP